MAKVEVEPKVTKGSQSTDVIGEADKPITSGQLNQELLAIVQELAGLVEPVPAVTNVQKVSPQLAQRAKDVVERAYRSGLAKPPK